MKKKKVELITLQRVPNYGSVLQAYATQKTLEKLGYEVEIINYFPERMSIKAMLRRIKNKNNKLKKSLLLRTIARIIILPSYLIRFSSFKKFYKNLNMTKYEYHSNEELKENIPTADIYCTGSDQVWNAEWNEGIDKALFLDFVPTNKRKIAYAASFGKPQLSAEEIDLTKDYLQKYNKISLREKSGVEICEKLNIKNTTNVVDPTLLLIGKEWRKISSNKYKNRKYILVYNLNRNKKIDKYAENLSKVKGFPILYLSYQLHEFYKKGKMICNPIVEDFISLIDNAEFVISDSFHATAFSLNLNKQFIIVYPEKYSTRLQNILELLDLEDRVAKDENDLSVIEKRINYEKTSKELDKIRNKSFEWLKKSLEG